LPQSGIHLGTPPVCGSGREPSRASDHFLFSEAVLVREDG